jgi:hypothetical protein
VEASLLPSKEIRDLCEHAIVVVLRRNDAACVELRKEFAVPLLSSWVVVLDGKGETLDSWVGDAAGAGCKKDSVSQFPGNLVRLIRLSLERSETIEELERRWKQHRNDTELFEALARRLGEMLAYGRLQQLCQAAAADPELVESQRDGFRIQAFVAWASDDLQRLFTQNDRARFVREGERLLVELAAHPQAADLVEALFSRGYTHCFDVPGQSAAAIARLEGASREAKDADALKQHIRKLGDVREGWMSRTKQALERIEDASTKKFFAAMLGDEQAAIDVFSQPPYSERPEYGDWLREAKRKAERRCSREPPVE